MMIEPAPPAIRQRLDPQERVLWWGRPPRGVMFRASDWFIIPFSIVWCGTVLFGGMMGGEQGMPVFMRLFLLIFLAFGLYMLIGRFFHDAWRRSGTFYAVTPKRALIVGARNVNSIALDRLSQLNLKESRGGRGSIVFGPETIKDSDGESVSNMNGAPAVPTFESIPDAAQVFALIRRTQADIKLPR